MWSAISERRGFCRMADSYFYKIESYIQYGATGNRFCKLIPCERCAARLALRETAFAPGAARALAFGLG